MAVGVSSWRLAGQFWLPWVCGVTLGVVCWDATRSAVQAETVVAVVSDTSAPEFAAAAKLFVAREPEHHLIVRSTSQVAAITDEALGTLLGAADVLLLTAVFGDEAVRIREVLAQRSPQTVVPLHGDAALMAYARVDGRRAFAELAPDAASTQLRELASRPSQRQPPPTAEAEQWLAQARRYRDGRGADNLASLLMLLVRGASARGQVPLPQPLTAVRFLDAKGQTIAGSAFEAKPTVALLDYAYGDQAGDRAVHAALCDALVAQGLGCVSVLAGWGEPSLEALAKLRRAQKTGALALTAVVVLQDFVLGGSAGQARAGRALAALGVPAIKAVRMAERSAAAWEVSEEGLPVDSVHYRLSMPELQGSGEAFVVAAAGPMRLDSGTGLEYHPLAPVRVEIEALAARVRRWHALRSKDNREKRVAIVYYNHPPGRHNIGADNLDVPASLFAILKHLRAAGYDTGALPESHEALLEQLQLRGVNLPEDKAALAAMAGRVATLPQEQYERYFAGLPLRTQRSLQQGPLGGLIAAVATAVAGEQHDLARQHVTRVLDDVQHLLEGAEHPQRAVALRLLQQLRQRYVDLLEGRADDLGEIEATSQALRDTGIEGLSGWGPPPGQVMTVGGELLVPGLTFGKVFVGPQPPRGWELNEELLHANLAFPPPHQYLAFYEYLRSVQRADVVVHLGRHSTYEFLPGRRAGLGADDFPRVVLGDLPSVYVYIVDGVGEGIQAKRRGQAVIVDHLTPSLSTTPLYDELLSLRQLVESYEVGAGVEGHAGAQALSEIRATIERLHLREELEASMRPELQVRGIAFDEVDGALLVHEVGHYLTKIQERFMPHGLHVFAQPWGSAAVERMLTSMAGADKHPQAAWRKALQDSPDREAQALLTALAGGFVSPGPGNDPIRSPEVLPTGRNFHALDASVLPTRLGYTLGAELAARARAESPGSPEGAEAVVLWASDTVRDEGAMVAFGMSLLGISPQWNSRGIVAGLQRQPLSEEQTRRDVTFVASGLFRDLYGHLIEWLDRACLLALDGASATIVREHPELTRALEAALSPLVEARQAGTESLAENRLAAHWVEAARELVHAGEPAERAGPMAAARVFGDAPGSYGAGINRLAERSGAWHSRQELVRTYVRRMGHAYGGGRAGVPARPALRRQLMRTEHTYLGRASNLYGMLDNNDVFDYLGGLGMAVEQVRGAPPQAHVIQHANPEAAVIEALPSALLQELRGRHLNPTYLKSLMAHGYAGARTMGSAFMENLWGWQVTSPHIIKSWAWDEVKAVYMDDKHGIGLSEFLSDGQNVHVKTNMQAILLVAAHKGFWTPDAETLRQLSEAFARAVVEHGLPGSGHTRPDHPLMAEVKQRLTPELAQALQSALDRAQGQSSATVASELASADHPENVEAQVSELATPRVLWALAAGVALLAMAGFGFERWRSRR